MGPCAAITCGAKHKQNDEIYLQMVRGGVYHPYDVADLVRTALGRVQ